tara:strand:- start:1201 stop:1455 length:255 start_codon:yes stop_codon:yes gene_type:complete
MLAQLITVAIVLPFTLVFIYAVVHEYKRYKSEGRASYGLVYDEETGTTHVTGVAQEEDWYDPNEFDPSVHNEPEIKTDNDNDRA